MYIIFQIIITLIALYLYRNTTYLSEVSQYSLITYVILSGFIILLISLFHFPVWINLLLFIIYGIIYGAILHHSNYYIPKDILDQLIIGFFSIFILLFIIMIMLFNFYHDVKWYKLIIVGGFIGILAILINKILIKSKLLKNDITDRYHKYFLYISIIFFGMYFTYSSNVLLRLKYEEDYIKGAIDLYLGFLNTIIYILELDNLI